MSICCRLEDNEDEEEEPDPDAKRGITYQVLSCKHSHCGGGIIQLIILDGLTFYKQG